MATTVQLSDSTGALWNVGITDGGVLIQTAAGATGSPIQVLVLTDVQRAFLWDLGITTGGILTLTQAGAYLPPTEQRAGDQTGYFALASPSDFLFAVTVQLSYQNGVFSGLLQQKRIGTYSPDPVAGALYNGDQKPLYPPLFQPAGPGTPVFINQAGTIGQETIGEMQATYACGCGAMFNDPEVVFDTLNGVQAALVCCPICRFISRIITPASLLWAFPNDVVYP